ncbi:MAG: type II toxin-antitoxin system RelE/ParE family toxin [Methylococcaceae bacterium]|nr:type II toxin-antitoxin system RelE/ParE family toxin [Methylococcaceae bacterium]
MEIKFHSRAEAELDDGYDYYQQQKPNLEKKFIREIHAAIQSIRRNPEAWQIIEGNIRRCLVKRFPYGIVYQISEKEVFIIAIANLHREPNYWKYRTLNNE